ncbi:MAG: hypothetical protein ACREQ5_13075 [Candidatus Dormibacteria bacterium]
MLATDKIKAARRLAEIHQKAAAASTLHGFSPDSDEALLAAKDAIQADMYTAYAQSLARTEADNLIKDSVRTPRW